MLSSSLLHIKCYVFLFVFCFNNVWSTFLSAGSQQQVLTTEWWAFLASSGQAGTFSVWTSCSNAFRQISVHLFPNIHVQSSYLTSTDLEWWTKTCSMSRWFQELIALAVKKCGPYFYSGFIWLTFQLKDLPFPSASTIRNLLNRYVNQINSALPLQQTK